VSSRDVARGLAFAATEARRRGNLARGDDRHLVAVCFDDLADWCDMEAAIRYDDGAEADAAPLRLLLFVKPEEP
jgi:hypothetical protein